MIREIVKDTFFLSQKSELATRQDLPVVQDLLDTICANAVSYTHLTLPTILRV